MMPHSFLFGHLWTVAKVLMKGKYPPDCHPAWSAVALRKEFPELVSAGVLYVGKSQASQLWERRTCHGPLKVLALYHVILQTSSPLWAARLANTAPIRWTYGQSAIQW